MTIENKILIGKELTNYKKSLVLTDLQKNVIIGTLMGDASMAYRSGKPVYGIKFEQSIKNIEYINHLYSILEPFCGMIPAIRKIKEKGKFKERESIWFRTYRHDLFKFYFDLFYTIDNNKLKKHIPKKFNQFLNAEVLAYWFMDDGSCSYYKNEAVGIVLHTQGFTYEENIQLSEYLQEVFGFREVRLWKDRVYVTLFVGDFELFKNIVKPYILPCFLYKLGV